MTTVLKRLSQTLFAVILAGVGVLSLASSVQAVVSGGPASLGFSPSTINGSSGQNFTVDIMLNTGSNAISGVALRARYQVASPLDLEVVSVEPNSALGWTFPVKQATVGGGYMNIDIMGLSSAPSGYTSDGEVRVATVTMRPTRAISNKQVSFDSTQSQVLRKTDAADLLGTIGTLTVNASGTQVTTVTTPPSTPASPAPAPTPNPPQNVPSGIGGTLIDNTTGDVSTDSQSDEVVDVSGSNDEVASQVSANQNTSQNQSQNVSTVPNTGATPTPAPSSGTGSSGNTGSSTGNTTGSTAPQSGTGTGTDSEFGGFGDASTARDPDDTTIAAVTGEEAMNQEAGTPAERTQANDSPLPMVVGGVVVVGLLAGGGYMFWKRRVSASGASSSPKQPPKSPPTPPSTGTPGTSMSTPTPSTSPSSPPVLGSSPTPVSTTNPVTAPVSTRPSVSPAPSVPPAPAVPPSGPAPLQPALPPKPPTAPPTV